MAGGSTTGREHRKRSDAPSTPHTPAKHKVCTRTKEKSRTKMKQQRHAVMRRFHRSIKRPNLIRRRNR
ncbi:unnamed protein product [Victoria cruziana]